MHCQFVEQDVDAQVANSTSDLEEAWGATVSMVSLPLKALQTHSELDLPKGESDLDLVRR